MVTVRRGSSGAFLRGRLNLLVPDTASPKFLENSSHD
jgi:hypothetical protein